MPGDIRIAFFGGQVPIKNPRLLENNEAQTATNAKLWDGRLGIWADLLSIVTPSKAGTKLAIYRYGQDVTDETLYWFHWTSRVDVCKAPIDGDTAEKTCWTGETEPRITDSAIALLAGTDYPMNWYKLGVPAPANTPTASSNGAGTGQAVNTAYVYTLVNSYGQEGPPSAPSTVLSRKDGDTVTVGNMSTGAGAGYNITSKYIYRTVTGGNSVDYRFVASVAAASASYADSISDAAIAQNESLKTTDWDPPPAGMLGLIGLPNGIMAGFLENELLLSEPYIPSAWPDRYRLTSNWKIVGLGQFSKNIVVCTKGKPYIAGGTHPSSFAMDKIEVGRACVSKPSIASIGEVGVCYAAPDGLAMVGPNGSSLLTGNVMDEDDWSALVPTSMQGYEYNGRYFGFYDTGSATGGFIIDPKRLMGGITFTDVYATAGFYDPMRHKLYLQVGSAIKKWDSHASAKLSATWKSKVFVPARPTNPGFAQIHADAYPVTFKLYADGSLKVTQSVTSADPFRLPSGYRAREFEIEVSGTKAVKAVYVAETIEGLRQA